MIWREEGWEVKSNGKLHDIMMTTPWKHARIWEESHWILISSSLCLRRSLSFCTSSLVAVVAVETGPLVGEDCMACRLAPLPALSEEFSEDWTGML